MSVFYNMTKIVDFHRKKANVSRAQGVYHAIHRFLDLF